MRVGVNIGVMGDDPRLFHDAFERAFYYAIFVHAHIY